MGSLLDVKIQKLRIKLATFMWNVCLLSDSDWRAVITVILYCIRELKASLVVILYCIRELKASSVVILYCMRELKASSVVCNTAVIL